MRRRRSTGDLLARSWASSCSSPPKNRTSEKPPAARNAQRRTMAPHATKPRMGAGAVGERRAEEGPRPHPGARRIDTHLGSDEELRLVERQALVGPEALHHPLEGANGPRRVVGERDERSGGRSSADLSCRGPEVAAALDHRHRREGPSDCVRRAVARRVVDDDDRPAG